MKNIFLQNQKIGIMGVGNMGQAILNGLVKSGKVPLDNIFISNRSEGKLNRIAEKFSVVPIKSNEELVEKVNIVVVGVKPQDLHSVLEPLRSAFTADHILVSLAAGISISTINKMLPQVHQVARVMPNTAAKLGKAIVGYCLSNDKDTLSVLIEDILSPLGVVKQVSEGEAFQAFTVAASSGIGFVFEIMTYWQDWLEEYGFSEDDAREITVKTFLGASLLAEQEAQSSLVELMAKVTSKKGVTEAGLASLRELEMERIIRISFEKAILRDRQLAQSQPGS